MNLSDQQEKLAIEIAHALEDMDSLQSHRKMVATYSEKHLRKCLLKTLSVPSNQIRVSKGALYTTLVQGNARRSRD